MILRPTLGTIHTMEFKQGNVPSHWLNWKKQLLQVEMLPYKLKVNEIKDLPEDFLLCPVVDFTCTDTIIHLELSSGIGLHE